MNKTILVLSDFHAEPGYSHLVGPQRSHAGGYCRCAAASISTPGCALSTPASTFGQIGCDAPYSLVQASVLAASSAVSAPDLVLVAGDLVWHHPGTLDDSQTTFATVSAVLGAAYPSTDVCFAIGNNDVFPDYAVNATDPAYFAAQANASAALCGLDAAAAANLTAFGYFHREIWPGLELLVLNTDVYSIYSDVLADDSADPYGQLAWLGSHLAAAEAAGGAVLLVGHIPPSIDSYGRGPLWQAA